MSARRIIAPLTTAALALGGLAATAPSASAASAGADAASARAAAMPQICLLRLQKVRVKDLQNDNSADQVFARLGNSVTVSRPYVLPQTRNTLSDGSELFSGTAAITLVEDSGPFPLNIDTHWVTCDNGTHDFIFTNGDARYKVRALVQVQ